MAQALLAAQATTAANGRLANLTASITGMYPAVLTAHTLCASPFAGARTHTICFAAVIGLC